MIAIFEGESLLFVGADEAWLEAWRRRNAMRDPAPGMPYAEMYPGKWHDLYDLARRAQSERVVTEGAMVNADGDLGVIRFFPVGDRRVAAHWTPTSAHASPPAASAAPARGPRPPRRAARVRRHSGA